MKVIIKLEVSDEVRRAIRWRRGLSGQATRREVTADVVGNWDAILADYLHEYRNDPDRRKRDARKLNRLGPGLGMVKNNG